MKYDFFFSGNLFEMAILQLYEQVQSPLLSHDLYSGSHHFDSLGQKRITNDPRSSAPQVEQNRTLAVIR